MNDPLGAELELARRLAREAGLVVARYFKSGVEVERKPGNEPVTRADREAQAVILEGLRRDFPADGLLSEELADTTSWAGHRRAWVVDPLDGTRDFVAGRQGFAVMIGLLEDRRPVLGVVHDPILQLTYCASRGQGAHLHEEARPDDPPRELRTSDRRERSALRLISSRAYRSQRIEQMKRALGVTDEQQLGSVGLKAAALARGERDLYLHPSGNCRLWDTCAPEVVVVEAGGRMTDVFGRPLRYGPGELQQKFGILASNGPCHEAVQKIIAPMFPPEGQDH